MTGSRIGSLGLSRKPVLLESHRANIGQRRVQSRSVVPEQPFDGFVLGLAPCLEALPMQPLHLQRTEQRLATGVGARSQLRRMRTFSDDPSE